jgi:hypothetical protein
MSDPAVPAPPPAGREVRRHRIMERAPRGWSCDQRVRTAADDKPRAAARGGAGRRRAADPQRGFNLAATL